MTMQHDGANEIHMERLLQALGIDLRDQNFKDTPKRWIKFLMEFMQPYDPKDDLSKAFDEKVRGIYKHALIVQTNIPFQAVCAHHLVPVLGRAHIGYVPKNRVVGLSKLTRLVWGISHRAPSLQEDVGNMIVDALIKHLHAIGAVCVITAEHGCMACRGVAQQEIKTITSSIRGAFIEDSDLRQEFYALLEAGR